MPGTGRWKGSYEIRLKTDDDEVRVSILLDGLLIKRFEGLGADDAGPVVADYVVGDLAARLEAGWAP
jgi:hypothetical protein